MKKPKYFHQYKTHLDYYRTSKVINKIFANNTLDINDKINFRSMFNKGIAVMFFNNEYKTLIYQ